MAYMLPLRFVRVGPDTMICATKIVCMMSTKSYQARQTLKSQRESKTLVNACGKMKAKTAIFLQNGSVVASPLTIARLVTAIEKSNSKAVEQKSIKQKHIKVYDVVDEDQVDEDEDVDEVSAYDGEDDFEDDEDVENEEDQEDSEEIDTEDA